jgi:hypothetical protein
MIADSAGVSVGRSGTRPARGAFAFGRQAGTGFPPGAAAGSGNALDSRSHGQSVAAQRVGLVVRIVPRRAGISICEPLMSQLFAMHLPFCKTGPPGARNMPHSLLSGLLVPCSLRASIAMRDPTRVLLTRSWMVDARLSRPVTRSFVRPPIDFLNRGSGRVQRGPSTDLRARSGLAFSSGFCLSGSYSR